MDGPYRVTWFSTWCTCQESNPPCHWLSPSTSRWTPACTGWWCHPCWSSPRVQTGHWSRKGLEPLGAQILKQQLFLLALALLNDNKQDRFAKAVLKNKRGIIMWYLLAWLTKNNRLLILIILYNVMCNIEYLFCKKSKWVIFAFGLYILH